ncbi:MAG: ring-cleaving dioxygenase [Melioribacteraceae bacterium]|nr:ring-cleaving dioxygenase [Melioribacteraceae bacterium]
MEKTINGLHHITVLASDPQQNYDFYTKILGMRFVKKTVNFDAPDVYHLYYADEFGTPGTVLTFFPFPNARRGKRGTGEASIVSFSIPSGTIDFWIDRLIQYDITFDGPSPKLGYQYISFLDPDGMKIELVEDEVSHFPGWKTDEIPREKSIRKFFGTTMYLSNSKETEDLLENTFGLKLQSEDENMKRYLSGEGDHEAKIDIMVNANAPVAVQSAGSVHHIAWRTESDESQIKWIHKLKDNGHYPTNVIDRNYFHSIYFREPGGVLFEIATYEPGFMVDEDINSLGESLKLPEQHESKRSEIEKILIPLNQTDVKV